MSTLFDIDRARISRNAGSVTFDDPHAPWVVRVWIRQRDGRCYIHRLRLDLREPGGASLTAARLARLPMAQLLQVAAAESTGVESHPNETYYRMLARPKPLGQRGWDDSHWEHVLAVYDWATETARPGGGVRAVADLWAVSPNPTAYRWLAEARRRLGNA